jgi:hypothetical protein
MRPQEFLELHQFELTAEETKVCRLAMEIMAQSVDSHHDNSHIERMLDYLSDFIQTDEFRQLAATIDLKVVFIAILWHDCWRSDKDATHSLSLLWLTMYEGLGASRFFSKAARRAGIEKAVWKKISYVIKKHARFQLFPIKTPEAKILRMVDALDMFNPNRTYLLRKKFFFEQPIKPSTYRAARLIFRIFCKKDPKAIHDFEWAQKISDLRACYAAYGRQVLEDYKVLCDLLGNGQFKEFENYLESLREKYLENPEQPGEAAYVFVPRVFE